jgi:hypothetical protein
MVPMKARGSSTHPTTGKPLEDFDWRRSAILAGVVLAAIALRIAVVLLMGTEAKTPLEELFASLALEWGATFNLSLNGSPTAVVMPVYPLFLGIAAMVFPGTWIPVGLVQAFLGGASAWFAYRIAFRIFGKPRRAWIVLALVAFYPPPLVASARLDSLVLTGFLLSLGIWLLTLNFDDVQHILIFMAAAVVFAIAILTSGEILLLIPFLGFWAGIRSYHPGIGLLCGSAFCLACLVALMPWMGRNYWALGSFVPVTTGWAPTLERSLTELNPEEAAPRPKTDPRQDLEKKIEETGEETFAYQESVKHVWGMGGSLGLKDYLQLTLRGITFWISDYVSLFGPSLDPSSRSYMAVRVLCMTLTILFLVVSFVGLAVSVTNPNAWLLMGPLLIATVFAALFNLPGYRHLVYWPLYAPFLAAGSLTCYGWLRAFLTVESFESKPPSIQKSSPFTETERKPEALFDEPLEGETTPPLWPVEENRSRLEPIRKNRKGAETLKTNQRDEE